KVENPAAPTDAFNAASAAYAQGDYATALRLARSLAGKADANGQQLLGRAYEEGHGVATDLVQAAKWYRLAADPRLVTAPTRLGDLYAKGQGVAQSFSEAGKWYRKAADQNYGPAEVKLGEIYERGLGLTADFDEAINWFR